jgi:phage terminase large subunit-like protein
MDVFDPVDEDGLRIVRKALLFIARKGGKSEIAAAIALYLLIADGEPGAQVYSCAEDKDQASLVFDVAAQMVERSPFLSRYCKVISHTKRIVLYSDKSVYKATPSDPRGTHGWDAHGVIFDELHTQDDPEFYEVVATSMGGRDQPLMLEITTAGFAGQSVCRDEYEMACAVNAGREVLPHFVAHVYELPEDKRSFEFIAKEDAGGNFVNEPWWYLPNPNLEGAPGGFRNLTELRNMVREAKHLPARQNSLMRLYFNVWTSAESHWLDMDLWSACGCKDPVRARALMERRLLGRECYGGMDLSSTRDFTAWLMVFPDEWRVLCRFFLPEAALEVRGKMRAQLDLWQRDGFLTVTPGNVIDYDFVKAQILADCAAYNVREIGYDPYNATQITVQLQDELGTDVMVPVRQGTVTMNGPCKHLETLMGRLELRHYGNPILEWMAGNVTTKEDSGGNIKPDKEKSGDRIDGISALLTGLERAIHAEEETEVQFISFE